MYVEKEADSTTGKAKGIFGQYLVPVEYYKTYYFFFSQSCYFNLTIELDW
jgi:hypothetical protein